MSQEDGSYSVFISPEAKEQLEHVLQSLQLAGARQARTRADSVPVYVF